MVSWEERDISHSSTERFIVPQAFILTDYIVRETTRVIDGLEIDTEAVERNLELTQGAILSEYLVTLLTKIGLERPKAHSILRAVSETARERGIHLFEAALEHPEIGSVLKDRSLSVDAYYENIRTVAREIVDRAIATYQNSIQE